MSDHKPREWWIYTMKPLDVFSDTGKCLGVKVACGALCVDPETLGINDGQHIRVVDAEIYEDIQAKLEKANFELDRTRKERDLAEVRLADAVAELNCLYSILSEDEMHELRTNYSQWFTALELKAKRKASGE